MSLRRAARVMVVAPGAFALGDLVDFYGRPGDGASLPRFSAAADRLTERCRALGDILDSASAGAPSAGALHPSADPGEATREEVIAALTSWGGLPDGPVASRAALLVWTRDWLRLIDRVVGDLPPPTAKVAAMASRPWWRA
jgi:hypothetical protein